MIVSEGRTASLEPLRQIRWKRVEFHHDPETCEGSLLTFVYDIPYFDGCGVFPPFHIINQIFSRGRFGGGMSPGAKWKPFTISQDEYAALVAAVRSTPLEQIRPYARYVFVPWKFDPAFDHIPTWADWLKAVCQKHRHSWHAEMKQAGFMEDLDEESDP